jgi:hypothetical protein
MISKPARTLVFGGLVGRYHENSVRGRYETRCNNSRSCAARVGVGQRDRDSCMTDALLSVIVSGVVLIAVGVDSRDAP